MGLADAHGRSTITEGEALSPCRQIPLLLREFANEPPLLRGQGGWGRQAPAELLGRPWWATARGAGPTHHGKEAGARSGTGSRGGVAS